MAPMGLPPGFRFHPTDEELVGYYLDRKINGRTIELEVIPEVDLYKCEPWDLPDKSYLPGKDMEWYFYSRRDKKYPNGSRTNRATEAGYWKATGKDRGVNYQKRPLGMKKTLVFYRGRAPHGIRTNWVMHEYRLIHPSSSSTLKDSYAICRVFKKNIQIPKNKGKEDTDGEEHLLIEEDKLQETYYKPKNPSETSSSELTQGTPAGTAVADDSQALLLSSDEANSSGNMFSFGIDFSSNLVQMPMYWNQLPCPQLDLDDFPQIYLDQDTKPLRPAAKDDCLMYDKCRDSMSGTLEEILSLCSSGQDTSNTALSHCKTD